MADAKVTLHGDSSEAVEAIERAASAVDGLSEQVDDLTEAADKTAAAGAKMTGSLGGVDVAAKRTGASVGQAGSQLGALGSAVSSVSPAMGRLLSTLGSVGGAVGSLSGALGPMTVALAAVAATAALVSREMAKQKAATEATAAAIEHVRQSSIAATAAMREMSRIGTGTAGELRSYYAGLAREGGRAAQALEEAAAAGREFAKINLANDIAAAEKAAAAFAAPLQAITDEMLAARRGSAAYKAARDALAIVGLEATKANERLQELKLTELVVDEVTKELSESVDDLSESFDQAAASTPDFSGMADALLRAAADAGDFSRALASIGTSGVGAALVDQLSQLSDEFLAANGASREQLALLEAQRVALLGGLELSKEMDAAQKERADALRAEGDLIMRANEARVQAAAAAAVEADEARAAQIEWFEYESQSYEKRLAYEQELTASALARFEQGAMLSAEERARMEELWEAEREQVANIAALVEESQQMLADSFKDVGVGSLVDGMGAVADAFGAAAVSGADMGEALGKSSLKAIAAIAKQFGAMYMALGTSMLFVPGQQAQGAGLIAASVALMAIGGAVGAAGNKKPSKDQGGDAGGSGTATVVVDTFERSTPGERARDSGAEQENGDRYGVDRGRAWA